MAYDLEQVKNAYSELTALVKTDLDEQYDKNRIKGTEYANTYSTLMNTCLQLAMDVPIKDKQVDLTDSQIGTQEEQQALLVRQTEGFDDDLRRKMLDIQMNTWAMMFSSGLLTETPSIISNDEVSELYYYMKEGIIDELPEIPQNFVASDDQAAKVVCTWEIGVRTDNYEVFRDGVSISGDLPDTATSYEDTTAVVGTVYTYYVRAKNAIGGVNSNTDQGQAV